MILLQPDCLVFRTSDGQNIPCSAQQVTVELIGESASQLDETVINEAAQAVLHYFKSELGKTLVSVGEFAQALERVLRGLGFQVRAGDQEEPGDTVEGPGDSPPDVACSDLRRLVCESGKSFELSFYPKLRAELRRHLQRKPSLVRFQGLRGCVKLLMGAQRWSARCQQLQDQIVDFLRMCLRSETRGQSCPLLVE